MTVEKVESISTTDAMAALEKRRRWLDAMHTSLIQRIASYTVDRHEAEQEIAAIDRALTLLQRAP